jgi:hypothetical protein
MSPRQADKDHSASRGVESISGGGTAMTPIRGMNSLDVHGWLQSYEARQAEKAKEPSKPKPIPSVWRGPCCAFTTADGIYQWTRDDNKVRPIRPFRAPHKTEQQIVDLYCTPRAYHHSVEFLLEAPQGLFTFDELTKPEKWLEAISKYVALTEQGEVSPAAKQLHRLVEGAGKEFRSAQDRAWGNRRLTDRTPEDYERREAAASRKFSEAKQTFLQRYNRAVKSGVVKRAKWKKARICPLCNKEPLGPRGRKCDECRRETRRKRNRRYVSGLKNRAKTRSPLGIMRLKTAIPLLPLSRNRQDTLTVLNV